MGSGQLLVGTLLAETAKILPSPELLGEHGLLPDTVWAMPKCVQPQWHLVPEMQCRLCSHTKHLVWDSVPRALWAGTGPWWSLLTAKPWTLKQKQLDPIQCVVSAPTPRLSRLSRPHPVSSSGSSPWWGQPHPPFLGGLFQPMYLIPGA